MSFIAYLTIGDGGIDYSLEAAFALEKGGVDLFEFGIPFSDPIADGPVIQQAMERSLKARTGMKEVLQFIEAFRAKSDKPMILFSYYNPILQAGKSFLEEAAKRGANGLLILDQPVELADPNSPLPQLFIVSPSTSLNRRKLIAAKSRPFIYYACQKGTTGMRDDLPPHLEEDLKGLKAVSTVPVAVGFGISSRKAAEKALSHADGFIVGSYFVKAMGEKVSAETLTAMAQKIDPRRIP